MTLRSAGLLGGVCGFAWAASLRGWMVEIAGPTHSSVTWLTVLFLLLPGVIVGVAFGRAAVLRAAGRPVRRLTAFAPVLFATAILDPTIFHELITDGRGGGSLFVVATMLAGGHALGAERWGVARILTVVVVVFGIPAMFAVGSIAAPLTSPRGLWVGVYGASLLAVGVAASALPYGAFVRVRTPSVAPAVPSEGLSRSS